MKKSVILGCSGEIMLCDKEKIDYINFGFEDMVGESFIDGELKKYNYRERVCKISVNGSVTTIRSDIYCNQIIEAQDFFEKYNVLPLNAQDLEIAKQRHSIFTEVERLCKIAMKMQEKGLEEYQGETAESLDKKLTELATQLENLKYYYESVFPNKQEGIDFTRRH